MEKAKNAYILMLIGRASKLAEEQVVLFLEDGSVFCGSLFGSPNGVPAIGEVVFNTGMVGYPQALTDPSYKGQILCFSYPLLGNYGVPKKEFDEFGVLKHFESERIQVSGVVARWVCESPSHYDSQKSVSRWMEEQGVAGIKGVDTRALVTRLREKGVMFGAIAQDVEQAKNALKERTLTPEFYKSVASRKITKFVGGRKGKIALIDCGYKLNILRSVLKRGYEVEVYPYDTQTKTILEDRPQGVILSNGPGDPRIWRETIELAQSVIDENIPLLGICLGLQIIALSQGAKTYKLKYGHRGQNKPVIDLKTGGCFVTSQNHGYAVSRDSLKATQLAEWFVNADDSTVEGFVHKSKRCIAVQFHPEASPGPFDASYVFDVFLNITQR